MSFTPKGEELPKKGKELPSARKRHAFASDFAQAIAAALKDELAGGASIKTVMAWTGAGERTVKGWLAGTSGPSGVYLEALLRSSEAVYERLMTRTGRRPVVSSQRLGVLRAQITGLLDAIDTALPEL